MDVNDKNKMNKIRVLYIKILLNIRMSESYTVLNYYSIPISIRNSNSSNSAKVFDFLLPVNREDRPVVIKRVLGFMSELRRWFTMNTERNLCRRLIEFIECLPFSAFNDLKIDPSSLWKDYQVEESYFFRIGNTEFNRDVSCEEFSIDVTIKMMLV